MFGGIIYNQPETFRGLMTKPIYDKFTKFMSFEELVKMSIENCLKEPAKTLKQAMKHLWMDYKMLMRNALYSIILSCKRKS